MIGINIGTAFLQLIPSFEGSRRASEQAGEDMGRRAGESFSDQFTRDVNGRLRDSQGRFVREGEDIGQGMGSRAGEEFGDQFTRDAQGRLRDARGRFVQEGEQLGQGMGEGMQRPMGQSGQQGGGNFLGGLKGKAMAGIAGIGLAVGAAFMDAYTEALDVRQSKAKLQANLGLEPDAAAALGKTAGQLYANGYGESISELTSTVGEVFSSIQGLDIMDSASLEDLTGKAISFSQAFDTDVSESIQSVGTLMNSGLAKDAENAFDLITKASQSVPAALRGNVLEASDEYSQFFRTLGFSGDEAFGALVKGAEKGEFGIDKTGDAIKEFTLLSTDMSDNSVAAYESIGLNAQEMASSILAGGDTAKGAFDQIVDGILSIQDPVAQSQAALALFGTPLEDMNVQDIPEFLQGLKGMSGGMGDVEGAADGMDAAMGSTTSGVELFWRGLKTKLVDYITDEVLPRVTEFTAWLGEKLAPVIQFVGEWISTTLVPAVQKLAQWLGEKLVPVIQRAADFFVDVLVPAAQKAWEWFEVYLLPTIVRVGEFIGATIENLISIFGGFIDVIAGVFTGDWSRAWEGVKEIFGGIWDQVKNIFSLLWDVMVEFFTNLGPKLWEIVTGLAGQLVEWGGQFLGWIWQGIQDLWNGTIWPWFTSLPGMAWAAISAAAGQLVEWGGQILQWIWDGIVAKAEEVWNWFTSLPGKAWGYVSDQAVSIVGYGSQFVGWIVEGVTSGASELWNWIIGLPAKAWEILTALKDGVIKIGKDFVSWIVDGIKGAASAVAEAVSGLFALTLNEEGTGYVTAPQYAAGTTARGGVIPGQDPGRRDNVLGRLPSGAAWGLRSEEAVMVPEFTHAVGGAAGVYRLNRMAEAGRIGELMEGFAFGGVVPSAKAIGKWASEGIAASIKTDDLPGYWDHIGDDVRKAAGKSAIGADVDPSSARGRFIAAMLSQQGTSYVWGAAGPNVFDCSGLVSWALEQAGVGKGRLTAQGFNASFPRAAEAPGNLVTFDTGRLPGQAGHIGAIVDVARGLMMHTDGAGPARISDYKSRDGGPLSIVDAIGGGVASGSSNPFTGILSKVKGVIQGIWNNAVGPSGEGAPGGAGVERWRPLATQALTAVGNYLGRPLTQYIDAMLYQMQTESGGDPNALNTWDRNYPLYGGSGGLLQVIQPTFENALRGTPFANLIPKGKFDPWANMISSILYGEVTGPYHSLAKAYQGKPYDRGGMLGPDDVGFNFLTQPEAVLTPPETEAYQAHARALAAGFDSFEQKPGFTFTGDIHMGSGGPAEFFDEALWRAGV